MESHLIYEICTIIATLIFVVIAVYLIMVLKALSESLKNLNISLTKIESQIEPISNETVRFLENSNEIAESIQDKLTDLDPLMDSISNVGAALQNATSSLPESDKPFKFFQSEKKKDWQGIAGDLIKLTTLGVIAWQKIKKQK
jgi:uncharacterized protein YoxC